MQKWLHITQSLFKERRWLTPGIGVKRWLITLGIGAAFIGLSIAYLVATAREAGWLSSPPFESMTLPALPNHWRMILSFSVGSAICAFAIYRLGGNLIAPFRQNGQHDDNLAESLYEFSIRKRGPHIVAIGGGTGMPGLLRGLRQHTHNITAVVTVADDGGSSGRLRQELGLLPPGDFRNNLAALADDEALMTQVLQYRFGGTVDGVGKGELEGHAFGNLLLAALTGITGSFDEALLAAERVLALRGRALPSTLAEVTLGAEVEIVNESGETAVQQISGESAIPKIGGRIKRVFLTPSSVRAYPPVVQAIFRADLIVMGPGSLYTSILPNLLIPDLAEALRRARAPKIYICNLAIQPGETDNYSVADHVAAILQHTPADCMDIVLANDNLSVPPDTGGGKTVYVQPVGLPQQPSGLPQQPSGLPQQPSGLPQQPSGLPQQPSGLPPTAPEQVKMITADLVDEERPWRHDSEKLARAVMDLLPNGRKA